MRFNIKTPTIAAGRKADTLLSIYGGTNCSKRIVKEDKVFNKGRVVLPALEYGLYRKTIIIWARTIAEITKRVKVKLGRKINIKKLALIITFSAKTNP